MNLNINKGDITLTINDDPNKVISFNPEDVSFTEQFYALTQKLEDKEKEYTEKMKSLENSELDKYGIPKNLKKQIAVLKDICAFMRDEIDALFGDGTSDTAFGKTNTLDMFAQFFNGVTPYIKQTREDKMSKYLNNTNREQRRAALK